MSYNPLIIAIYTVFIVAPEITTSFTFKRIHVNGTLTASCDFVGVPAPNITWTHNSTMDLNERDSSVSIITKSDRSVLRISNLSRDDGGLYSCTASNFLGSQTNITNVFILGKFYTHIYILYGEGEMTILGH